jgi:hypothetical protein
MLLNERASKPGESLARCKKTLKTKADSHHTGNLRRKDAQANIAASSARKRAT